MSIFPPRTKKKKKGISDALLENKRFRDALLYIATYRHGYDGETAGRLGLYAHNALKELSVKPTEESK